MFRRFAFVAAAAAALVLAPTAAMAAYEAPGYTAVVSDLTPTVGSQTTITVNGGTKIAGQTVTLTINSTKVITVTGVADANGAVSFAFTINELGAHTATATLADGSVVNVQDLVVVAVTDGSTGSTTLATTGFDGAGLAAGAGALVIAGAGAVFVAKRRQTAKISA